MVLALSLSAVVNSPLEEHFLIEILAEAST